MSDRRKMAGSSDYYDGVLSRPFLAEHWYRGFVTAATNLFVLVLLVCTLIDVSLKAATFMVAPFSLLLLMATITQHQRFELDNVQRRYRSCLWVIGFRFGEWHLLPVIASVVVRHQPRKHLLPLDDDPNIHVGLIAFENKWQVLLRVLGSPVGIVAAYVSQEQAMCDATKLSLMLSVSVVQAFEAEG